MLPAKESGSGQKGSYIYGTLHSSPQRLPSQKNAKPVIPRISFCGQVGRCLKPKSCSCRTADRVGHGTSRSYRQPRPGEARLRFIVWQDASLLTPEERSIAKQKAGGDRLNGALDPGCRAWQRPHEHRGTKGTPMGCVFWGNSTSLWCPLGS